MRFVYLSVAFVVVYVMASVLFAPRAFADEAVTAKTPSSKPVALPVANADSASASPTDAVGSNIKNAGEAVSDPFSMPAPEVGKTRFIPSPEGSPFPKITLRGIVITKGKSQSPIALIEVDQFGTYVVRKDDTISLQKKVSREAADGKSVLRIVDISRQDLTLQMGSLGEKLIVR
tara:strand:- start:973 stop:1497 length:525 start_codon:yes stop_codon:yes gene_type:complete